MTDLEIYQEVRKEALAGAGGMLAVRQVFGMLDILVGAYDKNFSISGACNALDSLIDIATVAKNKLRKAKG